MNHIYFYSVLGFCLNISLLFNAKKAKANSGAPPKRSSFLFFNKLKQDNQFFQQNNKVKTLDMRREPTCDFCCVQDVRDPYN